MNGIQKFFTSIVPRSWAESMEAESRAWKVICGNCGHMLSIWDIGGVRWKAAGNKRTYRYCPACGQHSSHRIEYRPDEPTASAVG